MRSTKTFFIFALFIAATLMRRTEAMARLPAPEVSEDIREIGNSKVIHRSHFCDIRVCLSKA